MVSARVSQLPPPAVYLAADSIASAIRPDRAKVSVLLASPLCQAPVSDAGGKRTARASGITNRYPNCGFFSANTVIAARKKIMARAEGAVSENPTGERATMNRAALNRDLLNTEGPGIPASPAARPATASVIHPHAHARLRAIANDTALKLPVHTEPAKSHSEVHRAPASTVKSAKVIPAVGIIEKAAAVPTTAERAGAVRDFRWDLNCFHCSGVSSRTYHRERRDTGIMSIR